MTQSVPLSNAANLAIGFLALDELQRSQVVKVVQSYSQADDLYGKAMRVVYLFLESLRSLYGASDWQKAQNVLEDKGYDLMPFTKGFVTYDRARCMSGKCLHLLIKANEVSLPIPKGMENTITKVLNVDLVVNLAKHVAIGLANQALGISAPAKPTAMEQKAMVIHPKKCL